MPDLTPAPESFVTRVKAMADGMLVRGTPLEEVRSAVKDYGEKCGYCYEDSWMPAGGSTSFAEYDAWKEAREASWEINELTWTFEDIVSNILRDPELSIDEKANRVAAAGTDLQARIGQATKETKEPKRKGLLGRLLGGAKADPPAPEPLVHAPAAKAIESTGAFRSFKDVDGQTRWLAVFTNAYRDRDKEIFPSWSHKEFEAYVDESGDYPELQLWHTEGSRIGEADFVAYDEETGFMLASGTYDDGVEAVVKAIEEDAPLGVSHGFWYARGGLTKEGIYNGYRSFEISVLPWEWAANELTGFFAGTEVGEMVNKEKEATLRRWMGDDGFASLNASLQGAAAKAKAEGVDFKSSLKEFATEFEVPEAKQTETPAPTSNAELATLIAAAVKEVVAPITAEIAELKTAVATLQTEDEEDTPEVKAAKRILDAKGRFAPPSQAAGTVAEANDPIVAQAVKAVEATGGDDEGEIPEHMQEIFSMFRGAAASGG